MKTGAEGARKYLANKRTDQKGQKRRTCRAHQFNGKLPVKGLVFLDQMVVGEAGTTKGNDQL
ncbi:MAG: hypothetical protein V2I33_25025 [Kangiellaceae bacterium]|nr:hypothetical protein [Kangiellaceae bacterium]